MNIFAMILTPLVGAAIGYFTNMLAIAMLFRPHTEKRIGRLRIPFTPGLIPKERKRIAERVAITVSKNLLTPEALAKELASSDVSSVIARAASLASSFIRGSEIEGLINKTLANARAKIFAEGAEANQFLPEEFVPAAKKIIADALPSAIIKFNGWAGESEWLDEKLVELTRKTIEDNFGRFVGSIIDHTKIYASIKEGVLEYLSSAENQGLMLEKIFSAVDAFLSDECKKWESKLPTDEYLAEKILDLLRAGEESLTKTVGEFLSPGVERNGKFAALLEKLAAFVVENIRVKELVEEKINAFAVEEAEALILGVVGRELKVITALGGLLGFLIGLVTLLPQFL